METPFSQALIAGVERVSAWADLLDDINVFPVADGDTGRNLVITRGDAWVVKNGKATHCAMMQQTLMTMHGKAEQ